MFKVNFSQVVNANGYVLQKGRKVHKSDIEFVLTILHCGLTGIDGKSATELTLGDIAGAGIWIDAMDRDERIQAGLCLSWLVDHGHVPMVKLPYRRGNTLLYRLNTIQ